MPSIKNRVKRIYPFECWPITLGGSALALKASFRQEDSWESADELLHDLSRVERVDVKFGNEIKTLYLNLSEKTSKSLNQIGMRELFKEETRLDVKTDL